MEEDMDLRADIEAAVDGPYVHIAGRHRAGEVDVPFYDWTALTAVDAEGQTHWFQVPSAALAATSSAAPELDVERLRRVYHERYVTDDFRCNHAREPWDCQSTATEIAAEYARRAE
jgi:hypothetical protein